MASRVCVVLERNNGKALIRPNSPRSRPQARVPEEVAYLEGGVRQWQEVAGRGAAQHLQWMKRGGARWAPRTPPHLRAALHTCLPATSCPVLAESCCLRTVISSPSRVVQ